jgi:dihydroneopterin aldolase
MTTIVRQTLWDAELARSEHFDKILVQNLEFTVNAGKDVWGRKKKQRALISVTVTLEDKFASASSTDTVDNSTIHYGILSKAIQARFAANDQEWMSTSQLSSSIAESVRTVAGSTGIHAIETNVRYLKGSMFGDGTGQITSKIEKTDMCSSVLYLHNVRIPCLIGVNSNERLQKQPVVVNLWIDGVDGSRIDDYPELESLLFSVCARKRVGNIIADSEVANICN